MRRLSYLPLPLVCGIVALLFAVSVSAQTLPPGVTEAQMDAALRDLSALYGSPVVRIDQAKAICNQEQYIVDCAKIGQRHDLYPKERALQVDVLLDQLKGDVVDKLKQCSTVDCLVEVATSIAQKLSADNPSLARTVELTPQKVEEKRTIADIAKSAGVAIEECQTMDPDTASLELLRACARLAKNEKMQKYIPQEDREKISKSDSTVALKEALVKGELSCGDGTIDGCGTFCLNPSLEARREGSAGIPAVCREIATRFFGDTGVQELERSYKNVQQTFDVVRERYSQPEDKRGSTSTSRIICPMTGHSPCPDGEYRQGFANEFGCYVEGACIPFNTKTQPEPKDKQFICPALPTVDSCPNGEEKVVSFVSPECGTYYTCRSGTTIDTKVKYPFTFGSGRVVLSFEETRMYCYESGTNGATLRGDKAECERAFSISVPDIPAEKQCAQYGSSWRSVDGSGNCFNAGMTEYRTPGGTLQLCSNSPVFGCTTYYSDQKQPPGGQREQVWNNSGLRSWIRTDASSLRIETLKSACANVQAGANVWMPGAGTPSSEDFGMPDSDKCRRAAACTSTQYFDGAQCTASGQSQSCTSGQYWNGSACVNSSSTTWPGNWGSTSTTGGFNVTSAREGCASAGGTWDTAANYCRMPNSNQGTVSGSCSSELLALLGSGCHSMGNAWFGSGMTSYIMPGTQSVRSCATDFISGCSGSGQPVSGDGCPAGQYRSGGASSTCITAPPSCTSGQYWNGSACVSSAYATSTSSCPSGQYWNGSSCTSSMQTGTSSASTSAQSGCASAGGTWDSAANYCRMPGTTSSTPCGAGLYWNGSACVTSTPPSSTSTSCPSGQYWNGSSCMTSSTGSSCSSGQYWNGSACVSSQTGTDYSSAQSGCASAGGTWNSSSNYCVMPSSQSGASSCTSGQYWSGSSCVSSTQSTQSTQTDYSSMQAGCTAAHGTWDSAANYCRMPTSSLDAKTLAYLCPAGHDWNGSYCTITPRSGLESLVANALSAFFSIFGF